MAEFGRLRVKLPWWWRPYLVSAAMVAWLAGKEPDYTKLAETVMHHAKVVVVSE